MQPWLQTSKKTFYKMPDGSSDLLMGLVEVGPAPANVGGTGAETSRISNSAEARKQTAAMRKVVRPFTFVSMMIA